MSALLKTDWIQNLLCGLGERVLGYGCLPVKPLSLEFVACLCFWLSMINRNMGCLRAFSHMWVYSHGLGSDRQTQQE